ncbi:MAG: single-stranded DNA-binding protein [Acidobacteria bacterium]|nr:single-stranded DNA-binding protein [Acidobacteriota bacterium]
MTMLDLSVAVPLLDEFLEKMAKAARLDLRFRVQAAAVPAIESAPASSPVSLQALGAPQILVECDGPDTDILLGRGGELLDAFEHMAAKVLRLHSDQQSLVSFDSRDFRALRAAELRLMAEAAAEQVERSGTPFELNPMNSRDRRIVHLALKGRPSVRSESDGAGAHRRIIIFPQKSN